MNLDDKRNTFLKYLAKIYKQNPNLPIYFDTIYYELSKFNSSNSSNENKYQKIKDLNLLSVQVKLSNYFKNNSSLEIFSNGYYLIIENRENNDTCSFYNIINSSIKISIPINANNLYGTSITLINFLIKEKIIMQYKLAKEMRNDTIILNIATKEDVIKIAEYFNKLKIKSEIEPNPFILQKCNLAFTIGSSLSYTNVLSKLLSIYFKEKKRTNTLEIVGTDNFINFLKKQLKIMTGNAKSSVMNKYKIKSLEEYDSFIKISELILKTLENSLTLEELFDYQNNKVTPKIQEEECKKDKEKILYIIDRLSSIYNLDEVHLIIMKYIETGNKSLFPREDNIRKVIIENFSPNKLKRLISEMGWHALISATYETYHKYGYDQSIYAINKLLEKDDISSFTNDNSTRSYLGMIIPIELLKNIIKEKLTSLEIDITASNLTDIILKKFQITVSS